LIERILLKQRIIADQRATSMIQEQKPGYIYPIAEMEPLRELPLCNVIIG